MKEIPTRSVEEKNRRKYNLVDDDASVVVDTEARRIHVLCIVVYIPLVILVHRVR